MRVFTSVVFSFLLFFIATPALGQTDGILTPEEDLWLEARNNTIVVYPEKNNPPFSYQSPAGNIQGLAIDYTELIAEKVGAKVQYLTPRSRSQILNDIKSGTGDVAVLTADFNREELLIFSESYITVPVVIVVRKDFPKNDGLTLNDFNGKKVAMVDGSAIETYVQTNYPRVVRESVTDDEIALQQIVLGEVDAAVMDVASLSFYLSKQVLSSVKIVGGTGFDYKPAFALTKDKTILQSILEKGLSQISASDRELLTEKWIVLPGEMPAETPWLAALKENIEENFIYILFGIIILIILIEIIIHRHRKTWHLHDASSADSLKQQFSELEGESDILTHELERVKDEEEKLKAKIENLEK